MSAGSLSTGQQRRVHLPGALSVGYLLSRARVRCRTRTARRGNWQVAWYVRLGGPAQQRPGVLLHHAACLRAQGMQHRVGVAARPPTVNETYSYAVA
jgi:hypothetical protein